ncbi:hypothetical protein EE612_047063, partial [Oryza sativa]
GLSASSVSILRFIYVWNCILLVVLCTLAGPGQGFNTQNSLEIWVKFLGVTTWLMEDNLYFKKSIMRNVQSKLMASITQTSQVDKFITSFTS